MAGITEADVARFMTCLEKAARPPIPSLAKPTTICLQFGAGRTWVLIASPKEPGTLEQREESTAVADLTVKCTLPVLLDIANGRRKPAVAFMKGDISVKGDRAAFNPLAGVLRAAAADFKSQRLASELRNAATPTASSGTLRITVHGSSIVADAREKYAVYLIEAFEGETRWTFTRRWSEVRSLARRLSRVGGIGVVLPRSLDFAGSLEPAFLVRRAKRISDFLTEALGAVPTSVLNQTGSSAALLEFLSPGAQPVFSHLSPASSLTDVNHRRSSDEISGFESTGAPRPIPPVCERGTLRTLTRYLQPVSSIS